MWMQCRFPKQEDFTTHSEGGGKGISRTKIIAFQSTPPPPCRRPPPAVAAAVPVPTTRRPPPHMMLVFKRFPLKRYRLKILLKLWWRWLSEAMDNGEGRWDGGVVVGGGESVVSWADFGRPARGHIYIICSHSSLLRRIFFYNQNQVTVEQAS